jgi:hypothetical protein
LAYLHHPASAEWSKPDIGLPPSAGAEQALEVIYVPRHLMIFDTVRAGIEQIVDVTLYSVEQDFIPGDFVIDFAGVIEILERADMPVIEQAEGDARHNVIIVDEAVSFGPEVLVEGTGKFVIPHAWTAKSVKSAYRMTLLQPDLGGCQSSQRGSQAVACDP